MNAKETFEKIDFIKIKEYNYYILYKHKRCNCYIEFLSNISGSVKQICCYSKGLIFKHETYLSLAELQAINKQVEELGWNNERLQQELQRKDNIIKDIKEYVNYLVIFNQTINGKFSETQWGQDILELIEESK